MSARRADAECLVIGAGLAGSMVAMRLAGAGRDVVLVEREVGAHHKVCGEFLSVEAVQYLRQAGVDPGELGASGIRHVRLSSSNRCAEAELPFTAMSLSRSTLDEALIGRAASAGCRVRRGVSVEKLEVQEGIWNASLSDGTWLSSRSAFVATGKHDFRGRSRGRGVQNDLVGFKMHWRLTLAQSRALRERMDLFLFSGGYGGLSLVEDDVANLCFVVKRSKLLKAGGWPKLLEGLRNENRFIDERLQDAQAAWERPLAISPIPYGYFAESASGVWLVGDQAAVIPSFTGDGMSIALHSAALAAEAYLAGKDPEVYLRRLRSQLRQSMSVATLLSRVMVSPVASHLAPLWLEFHPYIIGWIANATRVPSRAMLRFSAG